MSIFTNLFSASTAAATLLILLSTNVGAQIENPDYGADLACNTEIGRISRAEIRSLVETALSISLGGARANYSTADFDAAMNVYLQHAQHDVLVSRVCAQCADVSETWQAADPAGYAAHCGEGAYAVNATHSALLMQGLDGNASSGGGPLTGIRPVQISLQSTRQGFFQEPSVAFPSNVTERLAQHAASGAFLRGFAIDFVDSLPVILAASAGIVAIQPDPLGTGTSTAYDRSYLTAWPVQKAAVLSYYAAANYVAAESDCTAVGTSVVVHGYSSGGANAVFAALALNGLGLTVPRVFSQAGVYHLPATAQGVLTPFLVDVATAEITDPFLAGVVAFIGASFSNEMPFLSNTGTGETVLSRAAITGGVDFPFPINQWLFQDKLLSDDLQARVPKKGGDVVAAMNEEMLQGMRSTFNDKSIWCMNNSTYYPQHLCQALLENSAAMAFPHLAAAGTTVEWCHSPDDRVVPLTSTQGFLLALNYPNVVGYEPTVPLLTPAGNHVQGHFLCTAALPTYWTADPSALEVGTLETDCRAPVASPTTPPSSEDAGETDDDSSSAADAAVCLFLALAVTVAALVM